MVNNMEFCSSLVQHLTCHKKGKKERNFAKKCKCIDCNHTPRIEPAVNGLFISLNVCLSKVREQLKNNHRFYSRAQIILTVLMKNLFSCLFRKLPETILEGLSIFPLNIFTCSDWCKFRESFTLWDSLYLTPKSITCEQRQGTFTDGQYEVKD